MDDAKDKHSYSLSMVMASITYYDLNTIAIYIGNISNLLLEQLRQVIIVTKKTRRRRFLKFWQHLLFRNFYDTDKAGSQK